MLSKESAAVLSSLLLVLGFALAFFAKWHAVASILLLGSIATSMAILVASTSDWARRW